MLKRSLWRNSGFVWPKGVLLGWSVCWMVVAVGIGYEAYKDFSVLVLISSLGFALIAVLLFLRSEWTVPANIVFSVYLVCLGVFVWYQIGRPGYLFSGVLCFCSTWIFREEIRKQQ